MRKQEKTNTNIRHTICLEIMRVKSLITGPGADVKRMKERMLFCLNGGQTTFKLKNLSRAFASSAVHTIWSVIIVVSLYNRSNLNLHFTEISTTAMRQTCAKWFSVSSVLLQNLSTEKSLMYECCAV